MRYSAHKCAEIHAHGATPHDRVHRTSKLVSRLLLLQTKLSDEEERNYAHPNLIVFVFFPQIPDHNTENLRITVAKEKVVYSITDSSLFESFQLVWKEVK